MSANVEISKDGLQAAFASRHDPAWHLLGTVFDLTTKITTKEMLDLAHLSGWGVNTMPVTLAGIDDDRWVSDYFAVVRTNPFDGGTDVLSIVGERYQVVQNESLFEFGDGILAGGGQWETAGSIKNGRVVFGSLAMPGEVVLDPKGRADRVKNYLLVTTSHDGTLAVIAKNTPVRVVCANTLDIALGGGATQAFKVRHTSTVDGKIQAARDALSINVGYMDAFSVAANKMIEREITAAEFDKIVTSVYPVKDKDDASKAAVTRQANKVDLIQAIYTGSAEGPNTQANITGTAWGAFNALTEQLDWYRNPRGGNLENGLASASGFDPNTNTLKQGIFNKVMAFVNA